MVATSSCFNHSLFAYFSATPGHIAADGVGVRGPENDLDDGSFPSAASTPELHAVDTSDTVNVG